MHFSSMKTLSNLDLLHVIEDVCGVIQKYFADSSKKKFEFYTLVLLLDTKSLRLLKNVTTCWMSLIDSSLKHLVSEYKSIIGKMNLNSKNKKEKISI